MPSPERSGALARPDGESLAWRRVDGDGPTVIWVGGFRSDMTGTKAQALAEAAARRGWDFLRYDHFAHGASSGDWRQATIGRWREDLVAVIDELVKGPAVLVGSSMGGWVSLLAALARPERMRALMLVAPAPDFTHRLMWPGLSDETRQAILRDGEALVPDHDDLPPYPLTRGFFDEARQWALLDAPIRLPAPVHILQGMEDEAVPWRHALELVDRLEAPEVTMTLIKGGDHRLSGPRDLARLLAAVEAARAAG